MFSVTLNRYLRAVTICNSLALLVSQSSPKDFAVRIAVLTALQKCWLDEHLILNLQCSCDGAINCISDGGAHQLKTIVASDSGIHSTPDGNSPLAVQSVEECDNIVDFEAPDLTLEVMSKCLDVSESTEEKYAVPTEGIND